MIKADNFHSIIEICKKKGDYREIEKLFLGLIDYKITKENFKENLYIKRLNSSRISAKDILPLCNSSRNSDFVHNHLDEFVDSIDELLSNNNAEKYRELQNVLIEYVPTIESIEEPDEHKYYFYQNGQINNLPIKRRTEIGSFYHHPKTNIICYCSKGIFFDFFPDPIHASRIIEQPPVIKSFSRLWTTLNPFTYQSQLAKGYCIKLVDTYKHTNWRQSKREPDFVSITDPKNLVVHSLACESIGYTGRNHQINGIDYFEIDVIRHKIPHVVGNELKNTVNKLFWNAENMLRVKHNLPKIGEGWLSEMRVFDIISENYPDSIHHFSPGWLKPQHYDVYIPSLRTAIEYQGKQHYEPVDFFGSTESFQDNIRRDQIKFEKSQINHVTLLYWKYDEPISYATMNKKFEIVKQMQNFSKKP